MCCDHPEAVMLSPECMKTCSLSEVPHSDTLILAVTDDNILSRVKQYAWDIVIMASTCVHLPCLGIWKRNMTSLCHLRISERTINSNKKAAASPTQLKRVKIGTLTIKQIQRIFTESNIQLPIVFYIPFILHSLTCLSSAPETSSGRVGWKETQLTPLSWPSNTCLTIASGVPNSSVCWSDGALSFPDPGVMFFLLTPWNTIENLQ